MLNRMKLDNLIFGNAVSLFHFNYIIHRKETYIMSLVTTVLRFI